MSTRITTPFNQHSTAEEVSEGVDLSGKRALVTGASSGIGIETARVLALRGAEVTLGVRDARAGEQVAAEIRESTGSEDVWVLPLDLSSQESIAEFVAGWDGPLHILVNNAGVFGPPLTRTAEGWELQFATNFLGHFALTTGLHPALASAGGARIVVVSSNGHSASDVDFDDPHFHTRDYDPWIGYGQSKTAVILMAVEAAKRWAGDGITANALHPGGIRTNVLRHTPEDVLEDLLSGVADHEWKTPEQGAATSILVATSPLLEGVTGTYFEDCNEAIPYVDGAWCGIADHALDPATAARLWDYALETVG
ncbi:MAG: SDR family NAD(P)-dependent oxidoreductase [Solirubrobacteraceae bacterium]|nr:SDR family NAD(P)-dependent oxidoreductase [Patulibacter sp.]